MLPAALEYVRLETLEQAPDMPIAHPQVGGKAGLGWPAIAPCAGIVVQQGVEPEGRGGDCAIPQDPGAGFGTGIDRILLSGYSNSVTSGFHGLLVLSTEFEALELALRGFSFSGQVYHPKHPVGNLLRRLIP
jgi:hypothetical protein